MELNPLSLQSAHPLSCSQKLSVGYSLSPSFSHQTTSTTTRAVVKSPPINAVASSPHGNGKWVATGSVVSPTSTAIAARLVRRSTVRGALWWTGGRDGSPAFARRKGRRFVRVGAAAEEAENSSGAAADSGVVEKKREYFLPTSLDESIDQARTATRQAIRDGLKRIQLEVLLPLIGATDLDDWPGGIQQQYKAAGPVVTSLLTGLVEGEAYKEGGGCRKYIIDHSDAVGAWESEKIALVLFPTAETLSEVEAFTKSEERPLLIVNTQWQSGQVISDFGFGAKRRAREEFVDTFEVVYFLKSMRIRGEDVRLLRRYPGDWQVFVLDAAGGANTCVAVVPQRPSYKELEVILRGRKGSKAGQGWFSRLFSELEFNQKSLNENQNS